MPPACLASFRYEPRSQTEIEDGFSERNSSAFGGQMRNTEPRPRFEDRHNDLANERVTSGLLEGPSDQGFSILGL